MHGSSTLTCRAQWTGALGLGLVALAFPTVTGLAGIASAATTETQTVPRDAATSVTAEIDMDFGDLDFNNLGDIGRNDGIELEIQLAPGVPIDLTVDLDAGSGELDLGGLDIRTLDVEVNAGEITVDMSSGTWEQDLEAAIDIQAGTVKLIVLGDIGVRIDADTTVGDVDADGFERDGDAYVTAAYGDSPVTLRINIDVTAGQIALEVAP